MYTNLWMKYLPVIRILLKKSLKEEQVFSMNIPDFERAGLKRKAALSFSIKLKDGRNSTVLVDLPLASSLISVLCNDPAIESLIATNEFHISLNTKYELRITHVPQPDAVVETATAANQSE